jgi:nicotinamide-nucleotide adenylyltransferase
MRALFVGRFQPLHKGHLHALKQAFQGFSFVTIAIGSSESRGKRRNPFSFEERKRMIFSELGAYRKGRFKVIAIPDFKNDSEWTKFILAHARFDAVVSGSKWVKRCLGKKFPVIPPDFLERKKFNATGIRKRMAEGREFKELVSEKVFSLLKKTKGIERVKEIYGRV